MTMWWYNGSGWCSAIAHTPLMAILWAVLLIGVALTVGVAIRGRHDPPAPVAPAVVPRERAAAAGISGRETTDDEFWRRLM